VERHMRRFDVLALRDRTIGSFEQKLLSGGEKKKVLLGALCFSPCHIMLLDEPFSGVDDDSIRFLFNRVQVYSAQQECAIVLSCHSIPLDMCSQFHQVWELTEDRTLRMYPNDMFSSDLTPLVTSPPSSFSRTRCCPSFSFHHLRWLLWREKQRLLRQWPQTVFQCLLIWFLLAIERVVLDSSLSSNSEVTLLELTRFGIYVQVVLFTTAVLPITFLQVHLQERAFVFHEISQRIYSYRAYVLSKMMVDCLMMAMLSVVGGFLAFSSIMYWKLSFLFISVLFQMLAFTDILLWVLLYRLRLAEPLVLLGSICYLSLSFIFNLGFLLRSRSSLSSVLSVLQHTSMQHVQTNLLFTTLCRWYPSTKDATTLFLSFLNVSPTSSVTLLGWVLNSAGLFGVVLCGCLFL